MITKTQQKGHFRDFIPKRSCSFAGDKQALLNQEQEQEQEPLDREEALEILEREMKKKPQPPTQSRIIQQFQESGRQEVKKVLKVKKRTIEQYRFGKKNALTVKQDKLISEKGNPVYDNLARIGAGAFGVALAARQVSMDRPVVIKTLLTKHVSDRRQVARFLEEMRLIAKINHENVGRVYDAGTILFSDKQGGDIYSPYFASAQYGEDLRAFREQQGQYDREEVIDFTEEQLAKVADGIAAAHAKGILHRDLKPSNIVIDEDGVPKIIDFGLGLEIADAEEGGEIYGTPHYMAPDVFFHKTAGRKDTDVYSLGVICYEMLTGENPLHSREEGEDLKTILRTLQEYQGEESYQNIRQRLEQRLKENNVGPHLRAVILRFMQPHKKMKIVLRGSRRVVVQERLKSGEKIGETLRNAAEKDRQWFADLRGE